MCLILCIYITGRAETTYTCTKTRNLELPLAPCNRSQTFATPGIFFLGFIYSYTTLPYLRLLDDVILRSFCSVRWRRKCTDQKSHEFYLVYLTCQLIDVTLLLHSLYPSVRHSSKSISFIFLPTRPTIVFWCCSIIVFSNGVFWYYCNSTTPSWVEFVVECA